MDCYKIEGGCNGSSLHGGREWCRICHGQGSYRTPKIIIDGTIRSAGCLREDEEVLIRRLFNLSPTESIKKFAQWYSDFYNNETLEIVNDKILNGPCDNPIIHLINISDAEYQE